MTRTSGYVIANDGVRLHYDEAGAGKAVMLIHGGGLSNVWWDRNLPALSRRFHVIAPDTRGCGRSQRTPWGHRTARLRGGRTRDHPRPGAARRDAGRLVDRRAHLLLLPGAVRRAPAAPPATRRPARRWAPTTGRRTGARSALLSRCQRW